jgi:hypothetical protein
MSLWLIQCEKAKRAKGLLLDVANEQHLQALVIDFITL